MLTAILVAAGFVLAGTILGFINAGAKKFWLTPIVLLGYAAGFYWMIPQLAPESGYLLVLGLPAMLLMGAVGMILGWCTGRSGRNRRKAVQEAREEEKAKWQQQLAQVTKEDKKEETKEDEEEAL